jgi:hypothetical protein
VDEIDAALVQRIFTLCPSGLSTRKIATQLTAEHLPTPSSDIEAIGPTKSRRSAYRAANRAENPNASGLYGTSSLGDIRKRVENDSTAPA